MYAENPTFSVQRYRLTKKVPGLRAYELSVVWRYERALAEYLRTRFDRPDGTLRADVIAAAVVAAHNNAPAVLAAFGRKGDADAAVDHALGYVRAAFGGDASARHHGAEEPEDVVVVVSRRGRTSVAGRPGDRVRAGTKLRVRSAFTRDTECHTLWACTVAR